MDLRADDHVEKRLLRISKRECMARGDIHGLVNKVASGQVDALKHLADALGCKWVVLH